MLSVLLKLISLLFCSTPVKIPYGLAWNASASAPNCYLNTLDNLQDQLVSHLLSVLNPRLTKSYIFSYFLLDMN